MPKDYLMPKLAMAMNEGTIVEWLVADGDRVEKAQALLVIETEKVAFDLEAPESGWIRILVAAGETVPVDSRIAVFAANVEELETIEAAPSSASEPTVAREVNYVSDQAQERVMATDVARTKASPLARKIAQQNGLNLSSLTGSGPGGRIVKRDVVDAMEIRTSSAVSAIAVPTGDDECIELVRLPVKGTPRASIARHMLQSLQTSAQVSSFWESDITELQKIRREFLSHEKRFGTRISVNAFIIKAMASAVARAPIANAALVDDEIVIYRNVNVGVATALPGKTQWDSTLLVPVIRNVQTMGIVQIDRALKALIARAREGSLTVQEMSNSTITLSSTAGLAPPGTTTTPVLNMPNAVIIGPSTPRDKIVPVNGEAKVRSMMPVSMTFDHRVLDGEPAARFCKALHEYLENPALMLA